MPVVTSALNLVGNTWSASGSLPLLRARGNRGSNSRFQLKNISGGGFNDTVVVTDFNVQSGVSWSAVAAITVARSSTGAGEMNNLYYIEQGFDVESTGFSGGAQKTTLSSSGSYTSMFTENSAQIGCVYVPLFGLLFGQGAYITTGPAYSNVSRQLNSAEVAASNTAVPSGRAPPTMVSFSNQLWNFQGSTNETPANGTTTNYSWNESAWTTNTAASIVKSAHGGAGYNNAGFISIGGINTAADAMTDVGFFNGTSWSSIQVLPIATYGYQGCAS